MRLLSEEDKPDPPLGKMGVIARLNLVLEALQIWEYCLYKYIEK